MILKGKKVLVVGLARTGVSVVTYLSQRGASVTVTDAKNKTALEPALKQLSGVKRVKYELGRHPLKCFLSADLIIVSPGVCSDMEYLKKAQAKKIPVWSELEFAAQHIKQPIIAVTGTNGKTTTTMVIGQMLKDAGRSVFVGGNIGNPLTNMLLSKESYQVVVAEVSSFQLELIETFGPKVSLILNITPDHLDRYKNMDPYIAAKARIFENQKATDTLILNNSDPFLSALGGGSKVQKLYFGLDKLDPGREGIIYKDGKLWLKAKRFGTETFSLDHLKIAGIHNKENVMASILAAKVLRCSSKSIQKTIESFEGLPHRLEFVKTRGYVDFYNDSKATNVDAVKRALESFEKPLILIMGGRDKGGQFETLRPLIQKKVKAMILMGEAKSIINRAIGDYTETFVVGTLAEAVYMAYQKSRSGDVILFSPGCSSFDEFKNYEHRGDSFKDLLRDL